MTDDEVGGPSIVSTRAKRRQEKARCFEAVRGLCHYCRRLMNLDNSVPERLATWDHKIPLSRGGKDAMENKVLACLSCNRFKEAMTDIEFFDLLSEISEIDDE